MNLEFYEKQKFQQWWFWLILVFLNGVFVYGYIQEIVFGIQFGKQPMSAFGYIACLTCAVLFSMAFLSLKLETKINTDGVYVRFYPFHIKYKFFSWESISKIYIKKYNPIMDYGGWGIRGLFYGEGKAYNVSGNIGLQLEFDKDQKLLIGTNNPAELEVALLKLGKL